MSISGTLAALQSSYPNIEKADLLKVLLGFYYAYTIGQSVIMKTGAVNLKTNPAPDAVIMERYAQLGAADLVTYMIEANNLGVQNAGLVFDSQMDFFTFVRAGDQEAFNEALTQTYLPLYVTLNAFGLLDETLSGTKAAFAVVGKLTYLAEADLVVDLVVSNKVSRVIKVGAKSGLMFAKTMGKVLNFLGVVALRFDLYLIWATYADYSSPFGYQEDAKLAYSIVATVVAVALFLFALWGPGAIIVAVLSLVVLIVYWASEGEIDIMDEIINGATYLFYNVHAYSDIKKLDFKGIKTSISPEGGMVAGSTLTFMDEFVGRLDRHWTKKDAQFDKSSTSGWMVGFPWEVTLANLLSPPASFIEVTPSNYKSEILTDNWWEGCRNFKWWQYCSNRSRLSFKFTQAGRDQAIYIQHQIEAKTRYEECVLLFICSDKTDTMELPSELSSDKRWGFTTIYIDVIPNTLTGLLAWNELTRVDQDGDGLTVAQETALGTSKTNWDTDGDGLSDGYEYGIQATAGTNPNDKDSDDDGLNDGLELRLGTKINDADSDDDGLTDGVEVFHWDGASWVGGGYTITVDSVDCWVFTSPLSADADGDGLDDTSEKANLVSPNAINDAPRITLAAGPMWPDATQAVGIYVKAGATITASVDVDSTGVTPITSTLSLCLPAALNSVSVSSTGDSGVTYQINGNCYDWDFGADPLLLFEEFHIVMTATASSSTVTDTISVSLPYAVNGVPRPISSRVYNTQDNASAGDAASGGVFPPMVRITHPYSGTILTTKYYCCIEGSAWDDVSWIEHVEVSVPAGTFTATGISPWMYTWELPDDGEIPVTAVSYDALGNMSASDTITVFVDTLAPTFTINLPDQVTISAGETLSTSFALSGTVSDNFAGLTYVEMRYNDRPWRTIWEDNKNPLNASWQGVWEIPTVSSAQGENHLVLRAFDAYGNTGYLTRTVFVDIQPPTNELTNRSFTGENPHHVPGNQPLTLYGVANDAGNNPLPADPAAMTGTLHSISDATLWLQPDSMDDNDDGATVNWLGDFNGDRIGDLAVGLPADAEGAGKVVVVLGRAGDWPVPNFGDLEFLADHGPSYVGEAGAGLGYAIQPAGDFDGNGLDEFMIGDMANNRVFLVFGQTTSMGNERLLDGGGRNQWAEIVSQVPTETMTVDFAAAGDVNNDSLGDILVSVKSASSGKVYLLLGDNPYYETMSVDHIAGAVFETSAAGATVAGVGDVDDDGVDDFAVAYGGNVYLFMGSRGYVENGRSELFTNSALKKFSSSDSLPTIVGTGDLNGDGVDDFAYTSGCAPVVVFGDSLTTQTLGGFASALSGFLASAGDVDKDGKSDILIGNAAGDAYLLRGGALSSLGATFEGVESVASAPSILGADLAGDGSSDLILVPSASAAAGLGYDPFGSVVVPFVSMDWLPGVSGGGDAGGGRMANSPAVITAGDVTVGPGVADYASIQAAINSGASRVLIEPGVYYETLAITASNNVTITGSGADLTYLPFPAALTESVLISVSGVSNIRLMNLSLVGGGSETGLQVANGASNIFLERSILRDMGTAIEVISSSTDLELKNLTIVGNTDGIKAAQCASVDVRSSIFAYNTGTALQYQGCATIKRHQYNLYWANGTDLSPNDPGGGELFSDPLFIDFAANDFRVKENSPVIDAGATGDPVPPGAGRGPDIGHREQTGTGYFADHGYCSTCENDGLIWGVTAFDTIQAAVDAAEAHLVVLRPDEPVQFAVGVGSGTFTESVVIATSIQLLGSQPNQTTIQGDGGPAVTFDTAVNAEVSGFTLQGGGAAPVGVLLRGGSNTVAVVYNLIQGNTTGISVTHRSSGSATFNTIISNTTAIETQVNLRYRTYYTFTDPGESEIFTKTRVADTCIISPGPCEDVPSFNWIDVTDNIISANTYGLVAKPISVIFSEQNMMYNSVDYSNVLSGFLDISGQDPLLTGAYAYLQDGSPAVDAASAIAPVPPGGGLIADLGWHELLAAPVSVFMGQADDSVATESIGVGQVEYAVVSVASITSPITSTLPVTWTTATLNSPGAKMTYWQDTYTPTGAAITASSAGPAMFWATWRAR